MKKSRRSRISKPLRRSRRSPSRSNAESPKARPTKTRFSEKTGSGADTALAKIREICLSLPDTKETLTWGKPHFRVVEKIFAGCGDEAGKLVVSFKLEATHTNWTVQHPRFWRAPYVGHKGWVSTDATGVRNWKELRSMILESYRLIAPKRTLAKLDRPDQGPERSVAPRGASAKKRLGASG